MHGSRLRAGLMMSRCRLGPAAPALWNLTASQRYCGVTTFSISSATLVRPRRCSSMKKGELLMSLHGCKARDGREKGDACKCL